MKALLLAAGEGTRLRPLTLDRPKPMVPVGDRPLLEHLLVLLREHGVTDVAINLHYRPERIVQHFGDGSRFGVRIEYSWEPRLLGTAGAAKRLEWFFDEPFFVLYGDVLTNVDLSMMARRHATRGAIASLLLYEPDDQTRCGMAERDADGRIRAFIEKPPRAVPGRLANAGICMFQPSVLPLIPRGRPYDFAADVIPQLLRLGLPVYGDRAKGYVLDIGSLERYDQAQADFDTGQFIPAGALNFAC
jgi:NDP-sugar pyrophosphorylase family protein